MNLIKSTFYSNVGWQVWLKKTNVESADVDMLLTAEKGITGKICRAIKDYNPSTVSSCLIYSGANNLF